MHDGERVLVHGALGGLAAGFPGIARQLGASRVTGTVRASDLNAAQQAELPYDEIVDSAELPARLAGERFDIVIDPVGGSVRTASLDLLAPGDACSWSVTPAETGITRSAATGSGGGTGCSRLLGGAFLPGHKELARLAATTAIRAAAAGLAQAHVETLPPLQCGSGT
jgi:NADPH2:quinone reductase